MFLSLGKTWRRQGEPQKHFHDDLSDYQMPIFGLPSRPLKSTWLAFGSFSFGPPLFFGHSIYFGPSTFPSLHTRRCTTVVAEPRFAEGCAHRVWDLASVKRPRAPTNDPADLEVNGEPARSKKPRQSDVCEFSCGLWCLEQVQLNGKCSCASYAEGMRSEQSRKRRLWKTWLIFRRSAVLLFVTRFVSMNPVITLVRSSTKSCH